MTIHLLLFNHILSFYSDGQLFLLVKIFRWWKTLVLIFIGLCFAYLMRFFANFLVFLVELFLLGYKRIQPPPQPRVSLPPALYRPRLPQKLIRILLDGHNRLGIGIIRWQLPQQIGFNRLRVVDLPLAVSLRSVPAVERVAKLSNLDIPHDRISQFIYKQ